MKRLLKKILARYATSERAERAEVAGQATKKEKVDMAEADMDTLK